MFNDCTHSVTVGRNLVPALFKFKMIAKMRFYFPFPHLFLGRPWQAIDFGERWFQVIYAYVYCCPNPCCKFHLSCMTSLRERIWLTWESSTPSPRLYPLANQEENYISGVTWILRFSQCSTLKCQLPSYFGLLLFTDMVESGASGCWVEVGHHWHHRPCIELAMPGSQVCMVGIYVIWIRADEREIFPNLRWSLK